MKKKFELYCSSFKASACTKPTALILFVVLVMVFTMALGLPLRLIFENIETELFGGNFNLVDIDKAKPVNYGSYKEIANKQQPIMIEKYLANNFIEAL